MVDTAEDGKQAIPEADVNFLPCRVRIGFEYEKGGRASLTPHY